MSNDTCQVASCLEASYCKGYCRPHYKRASRYGDPNGRPPVKPSKACEYEGCGSLARSKSAAYCGKHYHREYRHGSVDADFRSIKTAPDGSYVAEYDPKHPLASKQGKVYVHRKVLYEMIGDGPHACHWCGVTVNWSLVIGLPDCLQVDHLDEDKGNNNPDNLVPSCGQCNTTRSTQKRHDIVRSLGGWARNDTIARLKNASMRRSPMAFAR